MTIKFTTKTLRAGQPQAYMDAKNVVSIEVDSEFPLSDKTLKKMIMALMLDRYEPRRGTPIDSTETLEKQDDGTWIFAQHMPFTD